MSDQEIKERSELMGVMAELYVQAAEIISGKKTDFTPSDISKACKACALMTLFARGKNPEKTQFYHAFPTELGNMLGLTDPSFEDFVTEFDLMPTK